VGGVTSNVWCRRVMRSCCRDSRTLRQSSSTVRITEIPSFSLLLVAVMLVMTLLILDFGCCSGRWRLFDDKYISRFLDIFTSTVTVSGWSYDSVPFQKTCDEMIEHDEYPPAAIYRILEIFSRERDIGLVDRFDATAAAGQSFAISLEKLATFQGRSLLSLGEVIPLISGCQIPLSH